MGPDQRRLLRLEAQIIKAAAHPLRLAILDCLRTRERCVCEIARCIRAGRPNVSRHLALMTRAGLLTSRKRGLQVFYKLRTPCILKFLSCVRECLRSQLRDDASLLRRLR